MRRMRDGKENSGNGYADYPASDYRAPCGCGNFYYQYFFPERYPGQGCICTWHNTGTAAVSHAHLRSSWDRNHYGVSVERNSLYYLFCHRPDGKYERKTGRSGDKSGGWNVDGVLEGDPPPVQNYNYKRLFDYFCIRPWSV